MKNYDNNSSDTNENCCSICYEYMANNEFPIISCENDRCDVIFHMSCLKSWFSQLRNSKKYLNVTMGTCPFCKESISKQFMNLIK